MRDRTIILTIQLYIKHIHYNSLISYRSRYFISLKWTGRARMNKNRNEISNMQLIL
jgi:hypothetical protein